MLHGFLLHRRLYDLVRNVRRLIRFLIPCFGFAIACLVTLAAPCFIYEASNCSFTTDGLHIAIALFSLSGAAIGVISETIRLAVPNLRSSSGFTTMLMYGLVGGLAAYGYLYVSTGPIDEYSYFAFVLPIHVASFVQGAIRGALIRPSVTRSSRAPALTRYKVVWVFAGLIFIEILISLKLTHDFPEYSYVATSPPEFDPQRVPLRVAYVANPRLEHFSTSEIDLLLHHFKTQSKALLGVTIEIESVELINIKDLFAAIPPAVVEISRSQTFDVHSVASDDAETFIHSMARSFLNAPYPIRELAAFSADHLISAPTTIDAFAFAEAVFKTLRARLRNLHRIVAADGNPVIDDSDYNVWTSWVGVGYSGVPYDIILTNQLIASATYGNVEIHSAIRGALPVGTAAYSESGRYGGFAFFSLFPFKNNSAEMRNLRGGESYTKMAAAKYAGTYLVHEIGHLLYRYGHPFNQPACVMNPATLLRFREWYEAVVDSSCPIHGVGAMQQGTANFSKLQFETNDSEP